MGQYVNQFLSLGLCLFLSFSLYFVLNLEMNQARGNALQLRRTDFVFFWTTLLKEKVEKIFPIYNK